MTRWTLMLALVATACADGGDKDDSDTDVATTDETEETDDTTSSDDTDVEDTDVEDTDVEPTGCVLSEASAETQLVDDPISTDIVVFKRFIEVCYDDESLTGKWRYEIDNESGGRWCEAEMSFASSTSITDESCPDCDAVFEPVAFSGDMVSDDDLCALFGIDAEFFGGLEGQFGILGIDDGLPELYTISKGWYPVDEADDTVKTWSDEDGTGHLLLSFEYSYEFGE